MRHKYFIAILPPPHVIKEITAFKQYASDHFDSRRAFRSPAHVTLQPPFDLNEEVVENLKNELLDFVKGQQPFSMELKDFNCFPPRVIYVNVIKTEALDQLRAQLMNTLF